MSFLEYKITKEYEGMKIREFLKNNIELSTRLIRGAALDKRLKVNKKEVKLNYVLKEGDMINIQVSKEETQNIEPQNIPIDIVYEDEDLLIVNKSPYMVVHPTKGHPSGTLSNGVLYYFKEKGENCIVRLVSRLDMNTSGLIIIAKNQFCHMALSKAMQGDTFKKYYLSIIHGNLKEKEGTIDLPIYRPSEDVIKRIVHENGQNSITHYKVLESYAKGELVELLLETGRTHQIRVHLSHLGHPIYGDELYGEEFNDEEFIKRQALHAYGVEFIHPKTKKTIVIKSELPEDMKKLIELIK